MRNHFALILYGLISGPHADLFIIACIRVVKDPRAHAL